MQLSDRKLWKAWKNQRFSHPSHSKRRGTALRAVIMIMKYDAEEVSSF
jgi:hypothetical protein